MFIDKYFLYYLVASLKNFVTRYVTIEALRTQIS
jgi:hypothetical protein